ncbi:MULTISPECIES: hypothetical protein [unclassified Streptosporangium]|uniref:hypothetical protein n=1 Tax=Streptosporangium sp. NPDC005286 TaxID=3154463 RepID=UPI0033AC4937
MTWFHRHRMQAVDVRHDTYTIGGGQVTLILRRRQCGKHDTEAITGHWPAERFLPVKEV